MSVVSTLDGWARPTAALHTVSSNKNIAVIVGPIGQNQIDSVDTLPDIVDRGSPMHVNVRAQ